MTKEIEVNNVVQHNRTGETGRVLTVKANLLRVLWFSSMKAADARLDEVEKISDG